MANDVDMCVWATMGRKGRKSWDGSAGKGMEERVGGKTFVNYSTQSPLPLPADTPTFEEKTKLVAGGRGNQHMKLIAFALVCCKCKLVLFPHPLPTTHSTHHPLHPSHHPNQNQNQIKYSLYKSVINNAIKWVMELEIATDI